MRTLIKTFVLALCLACVAEGAFFGVAALFGRKGILISIERVTDAIFMFHFLGYQLGLSLKLSTGLHALLCVLFGVLQFTAVLWPLIFLFRLQSRQ